MFQKVLLIWTFEWEKIVLQANRTLKFQVLRSNLLLADFKLQWISVTEWYERCELEAQNLLPMEAVMIFFAAVIIKKYLGTQS